MEKIYDVIVVGGGPAGLNTARILGREGIEVLLLEEKENVGKNVLCTGIVGKELFERFGISKDSVLRDIKSVRLVSPFGTTILYTHPSTFAYVIDREKFNAFLFNDALSKGVETKLSHRVVDVDVKKGGVDVIAFDFKNCELKRFKGQMLVLATGVKIELAKKLGLGYPVSFLKSAQKIMELKEEYVTIIIGNSISKSGFAWIVPEKVNLARVGLMTEGDPKKGFENLSKKYFQDENLEGIKFKPIAQGLVSKTYGERVISVGECAGQVKTTTGGGIYFGLLCSEIAVEEILKTFKRGNLSSEKLSSYDKRWRNIIGKEIKIGYLLRRLCGKLSDEQIEKSFTLAQSDGLLNYIGRKARFDLHALTLLKLIRRKEIREIFGELLSSL